MTDLRKIIESKYQLFTQAIQESNAAGVADLYTKQAVIIPPDSESVQGGEAILLFWANMMNVLKNIRLETGEVQSGGEHQARENGIAYLTIQNGDEQIQVTSSYVVLWKLEDGDWKMEIDIMF